MKQSPSKKKFTLSGKNIRVAIVFSKFNKEIVDKLVEKTLDELKKLDTKKIQTFSVPGALEIPVTAKKIIEKKKYDVIIALGTVIKGETSHYGHVCRESIHSLMQLSIETGMPIINGILTVLNKKQARDRISRGKEFAEGAIQMVHTLKNI
jgi:6,7-dimethyl-8-ribityllumazine synthase